MHITHTPKFLQPFYCPTLVRLGKDYDGGYLVNAQDVIKSNVLVSLGIGNDYSFEKDFVSRAKNCTVVAYDSSVTNQEVKSFFGTNLHLKNVTTEDTDTTVSIDTIFKTYDKFFLKIDIDDNEYTILDSIILNSSKLTGLAIEFHSINQQLFEIINFICKLDLKLIHTHVNNYFYYKMEDLNIPDVLELSFTTTNNYEYRKNLVVPHVLDMPNNPEDDQFKLLFKGFYYD